MRVHDTRTGELRDRKEEEPYAILSHTWGANEQSFQEVQELQDSILGKVFTLSTKVCHAVLHFTVFGLLFILMMPLALIINIPTLCDFCEVNILPMTLSSWMRTVPIPNFLQRSMDRAQHLFIDADLLWTKSKQKAQGIWPQLFTLKDPRLSDKIRRACSAAYLGHFSQLWVDTSCIDKRSSSELAEAINSMFAWYRGAAMCYVYLADVPRSGDPYRAGSAFRHSRWFTRGWTLQELIAPRVVIFLSREWEFIGTKDSLADLIEEITGIDRDVLVHRKSHTDVSVAARMSWAAERTTTLIEDQAYCLLGLFDIVMTLIYGEKEHAFRRLQEKILQGVPDDSIFAWEMPLVFPPERSKSKVASQSRDAAIPQLQYMRFLNTSTGRFVEHPGDRNIPYAVISFISDAEKGLHSYQDLIRRDREDPMSLVIERHRSSISSLLLIGLLYSFILRLIDFPKLSITILHFFLLPAILFAAIERTPRAFRRQVPHPNRWSRYFGSDSFLDDPRVSLKIRKACSIAFHGHQKLLWMGSACINLKDNHELNKVLDSYYALFRDAALCYVYLADVPKWDDPHASNSAFRRSRWFTECSTLPDLVAPQEIIFLCREWEPVSGWTKTSLADLIADITGIPRDVLTHSKPVQEVSVVDRMSWALGRQATHVEDRAYCLLGILDVTMTRKYNEGLEQAFKRLLTRVWRRYPHEHDVYNGTMEKWNAAMPLNITDSRSWPHSLLGKWELHKSHLQFAPSPSAFLLSRNIS